MSYIIIIFIFCRNSGQNPTIKNTDLADDPPFKILATNQSGHFGVQSNGFHKFWQVWDKINW